MKYLNKPKLKDAFCITIELYFWKARRFLITEDSYKKRKFN